MAILVYNRKKQPLKLALRQSNNLTRSPLQDECLVTYEKCAPRPFDVVKLRTYRAAHKTKDNVTIDVSRSYCDVGIQRDWNATRGLSFVLPVLGLLGLRDNRSKWKHAWQTDCFYRSVKTDCYTDSEISKILMNACGFY